MKDVMYVCPKCRRDLKYLYDGSGLQCTECDSCYPIVNGKPVLLRENNDAFLAKDYIKILDEKTRRSLGLGRYLPSNSVNLAQKRVLHNYSKELDNTAGKRSILIVGSGRQRQLLWSRLGSNPDNELLCCDVDTSADVDLFCDAHDLPFSDETFDGVITTAVLEHVLYPERVAAEITRVLKKGGLLYSEIPFLQYVHEGAYDFTRFTLSGHRRLFNHFQQLDAGMVAGPGTALVWSLERFSMAFCSRSSTTKLAQAVVRIMTFWIKYFDYVFSEMPAAMDGASCTYFFGKKIESMVPDAEIIDGYVGGAHYKHT